MISVTEFSCMRGRSSGKTGPPFSTGQARRRAGGLILNPLSQILLLNLGITQDQASLIVLSANSGSLTIETEGTVVLPP